MSRVTIDEACSCGAALRWSGEVLHAESAMRRFRENHRHAETAGICGDRPEPLLMADGERDWPWCELKAGHTGMHTDGDGRHWMKTNPEGAEVPA